MLTHQAAIHIVSCYVFSSSIKVNSKLTAAGQTYSSIDKQRPLPIGSIQNQRSLIYLYNLVDMTLLCFTHPKSVGKSFLASNSDNESMPPLTSRVAIAFGRRPLLLVTPVSVLKLVSTLLAKKVAADQPLEPLRVDMTPIRECLGWSQPYTTQAWLTVTAESYRKTKVSV